MVEIGKIIKQRREELGLSLEDIGKTMGVQKGTVHKWETGNVKEIGYSNLCALSKALCVPITVFFDDDAFCSEMPISADEYNFLTKLRALNRHGRQVVETVLDLEYHNTDGSAPSGLNASDDMLFGKTDFSDQHKNSSKI